MAVVAHTAGASAGATERLLATLGEYTRGGLRMYVREKCGVSGVEIGQRLRGVKRYRHTFMRRLRQVMHPVLVRLLISWPRKSS